jgi:hypothetical protein
MLEVATPSEPIQAWAMSSCPITFSGHEEPSPIIKALEMALGNAKKHPVFNVPEKWAPDDI